MVFMGSAQAKEPKSFNFEIPDLDFGLILEAKNSVEFGAFENIKRGTGKNVFLKVAPSVVKVLTNEGHGSGVVISKAQNGLIITNDHVTTGYRTVGVVFSNDKGSEVSIATVLKYDELSDLALLKLNEPRSDLLPITIAKAQSNIGDDVHAIGHPLGEDWTYTRGYVSQLRENYSWKTGTTEHHVADVIQTQTPINPGNSGGPLVNDNGELLGINSFGNQRGQGLNFAVANSSVQRFLSSKSSTKRAVITNSNLGEPLNTGDENKNGQPDIYFYDVSGNDIPDRVALDEDEDLKTEWIGIDNNENDVFELQIYEEDFDGKLVIVYAVDKNEDGDVDNYGIDFDSDGKIDQVIPGDS